MNFSHFCVFSLLLAGVFGCKQVDELQGADFESGDAEFAIPLGKARTSIQDLLENFDDYTFIELDSEGVIHLRYEGDVLSQSADEFFQVIDATLPPIIPIDTTYFTLNFDTSSNQLIVDFARYGSGSINVGFKSDYVGMVDLTLTILEATKNGQPLSVHTQFLSPTNSPFEYDFDLSASQECIGYELRPDSGRVHIQYVAITEMGDTIELPLIGLANVNVNFSYIEGYLGKFNNKGVLDSINIEFFENWIQGDVFFENPVIEIEIENSFGLPTRSSIDIFDIITADGQRIPLESSFISDTNGINFVYPSIAEAGQSKTMTFTFNADNSNIETVLGSRPVALVYKVDAISNPDNLTNVRGFITDSSFYKIKVKVDLPLHGRASGFGAVEEFDLDLSNYNDFKEVEFKLVADNQMPLAIAVQGYFVEENGTVLDSLFNGIGQPIEAAPVDAGGIVTGKQTTTTLINFDAARFDNIRKAKKLKLNAFFSTTNGGQQSVKAFAEQNVEVRMGMKVKT